LLHLQRLSTEDGPGLRTTIFFKGCPLKCAWCHNPESISPHPQVHWIETRCIGCHTCLSACPKGCLTLNGSGMQIDRAVCDGCGDCAETCPSLALELLGTRTGLEELFNEVVKDRAFFERSHAGGVTLSGGEPLLQPEFSTAFLHRLAQAGIHTALDTCGLCTPQTLERVLPFTRLVLFDLKIADPQLHRHFTGVSNESILENLKRLAGYMRRNAAPVLWVRTPLIPAATDGMDNIRALGAFIAQNLDGLVERWELLAFNNLARDKYRRLDMAWSFDAQPLLSRAVLDAIGQCARSSGVDPAIVSVTGAARTE